MPEMIDKWKFKSAENNPIFIIGTGRSGTHWLGNTLGSHPEIYATIETQPMFDLSIKIALDPNREFPLYNLLVWLYRIKVFWAAPRRYMDKSHPNIWFAEKLKASFPNARFIGIERNPYATVASMMKRKAVLTWHKRWRNHRIPNRFLGITSENVQDYNRMSMAARCALRWVVHHRRMKDLRHRLGDALKVIYFEHLAHDTQSVIKDLERFLGLRASIPVPFVDKGALTKWRNQLSDKEIEHIQSIAGLPPDEFPDDAHIVSQNECTILT